MIRRRALVGLSLLCALAFCAIAAPSAFATKGTTAFTCVSGAKGEFTDAHCTKAGAGLWEHSEITPGSTTEITINNKNTRNNTTEHTSAVLNLTLFGQFSTVTCTGMNGTGWITNTAGPPMNVSGTVTITFTECTVKVGAKETCEVVGGKIVSKVSIESPTEAMELKLVEDGEEFAGFEVKCPKIGQVWVAVTGSATGIPNGATLEFTEASTKGKGLCLEKNGLCANSQKASLQTVGTVTSLLTVKTKEAIDEIPEQPISLTTTES